MRTHLRKQVHTRVAYGLQDYMYMHDLNFVQLAATLDTMQVGRNRKMTLEIAAQSPVDL